MAALQSITRHGGNVDAPCTQSLFLTKVETNSLLSTHGVACLIKILWLARQTLSAALQDIDAGHTRT